jgi:hypothetical protein
VLVARVTENVRAVQSSYYSSCPCSRSRRTISQYRRQMYDDRLLKGTLFREGKKSGKWGGKKRKERERERGGVEVERQRKRVVIDRKRFRPSIRPKIIGRIFGRNEYSASAAENEKTLI